MHRLMMYAIVAAALSASGAHPVARAGQPPPATPQRIDLAGRLAAGTLRAVNRTATPHPERRDAVQVSERQGNGVLWIEGSDLADGTIEVDVRGRDVAQRSFVGVAFHRLNDDAYDAVYLRPFNFRNADVARRQNAVQYIAIPEYDWARLRKEFPGEFENPVDESIVPTDWVPLRVVLESQTIRVFVGPAASPTLEVRKLGRHGRGMVGLWTGNGSDGAFANLRLTPAK